MMAAMSNVYRELNEVLLFVSQSAVVWFGSEEVRCNKTWMRPDVLDESMHLNSPKREWPG
jgi:hypothetical protein